LARGIHAVTKAESVMSGGKYEESWVWIWLGVYFTLFFFR